MQHLSAIGKSTLRNKSGVQQILEHGRKIESNPS